MAAPIDPLHPRSVGRLAVTDLPRVQPEDRVGEARAQVSGAFEQVPDLPVCIGRRLVGVVPLERLLASAEDASISQIMDPPPPGIEPAADQEAAAALVSRRGARTVAISDKDGHFLGLVPPASLISVLAQEHEEDLARIGGFLVRSSEARTAAEERVLRRLWHRLPWLGLGLAGAMVSAVIVGSFEEQLRKEVLLALFVPAVVYMADAVGTQTEALIIRGMAIGVSLRRIAARELVTGLVMGVLVGAAFLPFAFLVWDDIRVAAVVALALFVSCSIATLVAMALPYLLARLGADPAFGSGPLATVIQDLLSIIVYFAIAVALTG